MNRSRLFFENGRWALLIGGILASYISLTTFWRMPYDAWLTLHNLLIVTSLGLAGLVGYQSRKIKVSFKAMLWSIAAFFALIMFLYIGSYAMTTAFFAGQMIWIPFFYQDYNYHGFQSVTEYLSYENNYFELLQLQVFAFLMSSVMYFAAGSVGYIVEATIDKAPRASSTTQSDD